MSRSTPEWIGKNDDQKVPDHVRVRIFRDHDGFCHIAKRKIKRGEPWDLDHIVALVNGGEHRESNLAPALRDKHREKTAEDVAEKSRIYRKTAKDLGLRKPSRLRGPKFEPRPKQRSASRPLTKQVWTIS